MRDSGTTEEGFEVVFATNYLGHFLLTQLLLPHMAPNGRMINVSSDMHNPPGGIEWKGVGYLAHEAMTDRRRYSYSKLCAICFTLKLDELLKKQGSSISVNSFNPGFMAATNFSGGHTDKARALVVKTTMPDRYGELGTSSDALAQIAVDSRFDGVSDSTLTEARLRRIHQLFPTVKKIEMNCGIKVWSIAVCGKQNLPVPCLIYKVIAERRNQNQSQEEPLC